MISIKNKIVQTQTNFWNNCLFHPTDAAEDSWGKRILDRISEDKVADTIRIYAMLEDFTGFRNFFTLNFIAKPIYNAYILASKLRESLLDCFKDNDNIYVIPTKKDGKYAVLINYSSENFDEKLPCIREELIFEENLSNQTATVYCINKAHTNPYRLYEKIKDNMTEKDVELLREEGELKPVYHGIICNNKIALDLSANSVYLVEVE